MPPIALRASSNSSPGGSTVVSNVISDSCVDVIEERNSGGGRTVVHSEEVRIERFRR